MSCRQSEEDPRVHRELPWRKTRLRRRRTTGSSTASTPRRRNWPKRVTSFRRRPCASRRRRTTTKVPIIRLVNLIIDTAYHMRASDIHIEPMTDRVRIRYRVDGVCLEKDNIPKNMQAPLIARFKILSGMDIAEKRLPQDGRIKRNIAGNGHRLPCLVPAGGTRPQRGAAYSAARRRQYRHSVAGIRAGQLRAVPEDHQAAQRHLPGDRARPVAARRRRCTRPCRSSTSRTRRSSRPRTRSSTCSPA